MTCVVYLEGEGHGKHKESAVRKAFSSLYTQAGLAGRLPRTVSCGSRDQAYKDFARACASGEVDSVLLVDSEGAVSLGVAAWDHLAAQDRWTRPTNSHPNSAHLMVRSMEAWVLSDRENLKRHFKNCLYEGDLPNTPNLENLDPGQMLAILVRATRDCRNPYAKGARSFEVLEGTSLATLEVACPSAAAFFAHLRAVC